MIDCHGPPSGVLGLQPGQELVNVLNYEIYWGFEPASTLPILLSGGTVHLSHSPCIPLVLTHKAATVCEPCSFCIQQQLVH